MTAPSAEASRAVTNRPGPLAQRSLMFLESGDIPGALMLLDTHLERHPDDADAHNIAALARRRQGEVEESVRHLERAIILRPDDGLATVNLAKAFMELDRPAPALAALDQFLIRTPGQ